MHRLLNNLKYYLSFSYTHTHIHSCFANLTSESRATMCEKVLGTLFSCLKILYNIFVFLTCILRLRLFYYSVHRTFHTDSPPA